MSPRTAGAALLAASLAALPCAVAPAWAFERYAPVATVVAPASDPALAALISGLKQAAEAKDFAAFAARLAPSFAAYRCTGDALRPCGPGHSRPQATKASPAARLSMAFCCLAADSGAVPEADRRATLFAMAAASLQAAPGPNPDAPQSVCAPAIPAFDRKRARAAAKANGVAPENLLRASAAVELRERADAAAPVVARIGPGEILFVASDLTAEIPAGWTAYVAPEGRIGYSSQGGMDELTPPALCFSRSAAGWALAYTIDRGPE